MQASWGYIGSTIGEVVRVRVWVRKFRMPGRITVAVGTHALVLDAVEKLLQLLAAEHPVLVCVNLQRPPHAATATAVGH